MIYLINEIAPKEDYKETHNKLLNDFSHILGVNLLITIDIYINYYFNNQSEYRDINEFKKYIISIFRKVEIILVNEGGGKRSDEDYIWMGEMSNIYDKIFYHGVHNPVEARRLKKTNVDLEYKGKSIVEKIKKKLFSIFGKDNN